VIESLGFYFRPARYDVTTLGELFTHLCLCSRTMQFCKISFFFFSCCYHFSSELKIVNFVSVKGRWSWMVMLCDGEGNRAPGRK